MGRTRRETIAVVPDPDAAASAFAPLDSLLWSERSLLQRLLYQLSAQELVITVGRVEWLRDSDLEISTLVRNLQLHELGRAAETDALAARYGLSGSVPLRQIIATVSEPWRAIMADHLYTLRELQDAVERTADHNAALLRAMREPESPFARHDGSTS